MKVTIFAATGGIGRHAVEQALAAGHDVTAAARRPSGFPAEVTTVAVDLADPRSPGLPTALQGADAVLSALGPRTSADAGITSRGTAAITSAMDAAGVHRLVVVSAAPIATVPSPHRTTPRHDPGDGLITRYLLAPVVKAALRGPYVDLALMEDALVTGTAEWTVVRPPRLTNGPLTSSYRTAIGRNARGLTVSRADVGHLMVALLDRPETIRRTVGVAG